MSKRKQQAIEAARQAQEAAAATSKQSSRWRRLKSTRALAAAGIGLLLTLGVISATVNHQKGASWLASLTTPFSSALQPTVSPLPSPAPQLSKEYLYAGSRLLAVEDANAPSSSSQPADLVVWRLTGGTGYWYIRDSTDGTFSSGVFGGGSDLPIPADFDGDGLADFCVFRPNDPSSGLATWYVQPSSGGAFYGIQFGLSTDKPVPADYDGDGRADVAVWRASNANYYILNSSTSTLQTTSVGQTNGTPLPADYDGDGRADAAVYNVINNIYVWTILKTTNSQLETVSYGDVPNGDKPVTGDFDGDGRFDVATRRDGTNQWIVRNVGTLSMSISGFAMQSTDVTVAGDYDGDGKTDAAVWRPGNGTWYIRKSSDGQMRQDQWGQNGDTPVPASFRR